MSSTVRDPTQSASVTQATPQAYGFWPSAWHTALGSAGLGVVTVVCSLLQADATEAALLYLFVVVLTALWAGLAASLIVSVIAIVCLDYFFTAPVFNLTVGEIDAVALIVFSRPPW